MKQRIVVAFVAMGLAILSGWLGALWARAARPPVPAPLGIEVARAKYMKRGRTVFATLFAIAAAVLAPFVPELVILPVWSTVPLGAVIGAIVGLIVGQMVATEIWIAQMPTFAGECA